MTHLSQLPLPSSHDRDPSLDRLKDLLSETLRVTISDTRIFIGSFAGTDQTLNIILINAEEYRLGLDENHNGRYVGQVVIPWRLVTKVEGETPRDNRHQSSEVYL